MTCSWRIWMLFFGLHVEQVIVCIENLSPWRMRAAKFTETLNAEDDTMPKKILDCSSATLPSLLRISFGLKVCFPATDRFVYSTFWAVLLVLPHCQGFEVLHDPCLQARQRKQWMANMSLSICVSCTLMYSHLLIKDIPHEAFVSWMQTEKSIQLLKVKS